MHPTLHHKITNPQYIANQFADYYRALYNLSDDPNTPQPLGEDIKDFLLKLNLPTISEAHLLKLNTAFTTKEIEHIIASLPNGKSSGPDGDKHLQQTFQILTIFYPLIYYKSTQKQHYPPPSPRRC